MMNVEREIPAVPSRVYACGDGTTSPDKLLDQAEYITWMTRRNAVGAGVLEGAHASGSRRYGRGSRCTDDLLRIDDMGGKVILDLPS